MIGILATIALLPFLSGSCAALAALRCARRYAGRGLLFHSITDGGRRIDMSHCTARVFAALTARIGSEQYGTPTVRDALSGPRPPSLREREAVLTFDDGFQDFYTTALPLIEQHRLKATVFPVAGCLGRRSGWDVFAPRQHLTAKELREIAGLGHEIGSHTMTHPDLVLLPPKQRRAELLDSRKLLEDVTGAPVTTISFPFGSWNIDVWETARECGYRAATAYRPHAHQPDSILPVLGAYAFDTPEDIMRKLEPAGPPSNALARAALMPHFAKGSPLWRFRPEYRLGRRSRRPPARCAR